MNKEEIIKSLNDGRYTIKAEEDCNCHLYYEIVNGDLQEDGYYDACWTGATLYINGTAIATYVKDFGMQMYIAGASEDDIPEDITLEMKRVTLEAGANKRHIEKQKAALVDFLTQFIEEGGKLYKNNLRGFCNEYRLILVKPHSNVDDIDGWDELTPSEWTEDYFYSGDACTQSYVSTCVV